jgi:hypothetical protein
MFNASLIGRACCGLWGLTSKAWHRGTGWRFIDVVVRDVKKLFSFLKILLPNSNHIQ